jgi:hypothetical protein
MSNSDSTSDSKPLSTKDPKGQNSYSPEASQRVVSQFEGIILSLWDSFLNIDKAKHRRDIFDGIDKQLAEAFGECLLFTAEKQEENGSTNNPGTYTIRGWYCTVKDNEIWRDLIAAPEWGRSFKSKLLDKAIDSVRPLFLPAEDIHTDEGPLGERLKLTNLGITRLWFDHGGVLCLGVSLLSDFDDQDIWGGSNAKIIEFFPELLATPLRIGSHRSQLNAFEKTCRAGLATEVVKSGFNILSSRVHLAWHAAKYENPNHDRPPAVFSEYDGLLANYLDARRYVAGSPVAESIRQDEANTVDGFGRLFLPEIVEGTPRLVLFTSGDKINEHKKRDSFLLGDYSKAPLSHHAVGRSMIWMAYKAGYLDRDDTGISECPFPREHEELGDKHRDAGFAASGHASCVELLFGNYGEPQPLLENVIDPDSAYTSWLRYLWTGIFYRAQHLRDNRSKKSEDQLVHLSANYDRAVQETRAFFKEVLAAREEKDAAREEGDSTKDEGGSAKKKENKELRVDWKWLYLWFLDNALNSNELHQEYGAYSREKHGFASHLDFYRDMSTAVLFGFHLVRFWDGAIALELWDLPELRPDEVVRARLRLLCEYAYREFKVDRAWQLEHHLGAQFQPEMILQVSSSAHREHVLHVMDVCLLGHLLLKSEKRGCASASKFRKSLLRFETEEEFLRMWYPAALLHDLGRAHEIPLSLPDLLKHLDTPDLAEYAKAVQIGIENANKALDEAIIEQFKSAGLIIADPTRDVSHDHGVISGSHLIHSLKRTAGDHGLFLQDPGTKAVLQAIVRHNRDCEKIAASTDPLSYFLVLCDHLQEWSRPRFPAHQLAMSFLGWTQIASPFSVRGQKAARHLTPTAHYCKDENAIAFDGEVVSLALQCETPRSSLFEPSCLWVKLTADLERIWFEDESPTVDLEFRHPRSEAVTSSLSGAYEMELLRDFAKTESGAFLSSWLNRVTSGIGEMEYFIRKEDDSECYRLRLGARGELTPKLLSSLPKKFYPHFVEWKKRQLRSAEED